MGEALAARVGVRRLSRARALVARRLRALPGDRRDDARHVVAGVAGAAARSRVARAGGRAARSCDRSPDAPVPGSGSRKGSGRPRAGRRPRAASASSATSPSSSTRTAPTCGRGRASSCSTSRPARRRMPSAPRARTGGCRRTAGTPSPQTNFAWLRQRGRRMAALYDGFRVDHLIGFYRTYGKPPGGPPFFSPGDEPSQIAQGERVLRVFLGSGAEVVAEDLGVIPDFARASLARLESPGLQGAALGAPLASRRPAVRGSRRLSAALARDDRHPRHRDTRAVVGSRERGRAIEGAGAAGAAIARRRGPAGRMERSPARRAARPPPSARDQTTCSCRFRTCLDGAIASIPRRRSATRTGHGGCRGRSTTGRPCRTPPRGRPGAGRKRLRIAGWTAIGPEARQHSIH